MTPLSIILLIICAIVLPILAFYSPEHKRRKIRRSTRMYGEPPLVAPPVRREVESAPRHVPDADYIKHVVRRMPMSEPINDERSAQDA